MDLDIGRLGGPHAPTRLVQDDLAMRQGQPLALRAPDQDQGGRARRHPGAQGADGRMDIAHGVVDRESRRERATRTVDVDADLFVGILAVEEQQLRDHQVGEVVIDLAAKKDNPVSQQARIDVVGALTTGGGLDDVGYQCHDQCPPYRSKVNPIRRLGGVACVAARYKLKCATLRKACGRRLAVAIRSCNRGSSGQLRCCDIASRLPSDRARSR